MWYRRNNGRIMTVSLLLYSNSWKLRSHTMKNIRHINETTVLVYVVRVRPKKVALSKINQFLRYLRTEIDATRVAERFTKLKDLCVAERDVRKEKSTIFWISNRPRSHPQRGSRKAMSKITYGQLLGKYWYLKFMSLRTSAWIQTRDRYAPRPLKTSSRSIQELSSSWHCWSDPSWIKCSRYHSNEE